jgi:hypothetical protein
VGGRGEGSGQLRRWKSLWPHHAPLSSAGTPAGRIRRHPCRRLIVAAAVTAPLISQENERSPGEATSSSARSAARWEYSAERKKARCGNTELSGQVPRGKGQENLSSDEDSFSHQAFRCRGTWGDGTKCLAGRILHSDDAAAAIPLGVTRRQSRVRTSLMAFSTARRGARGSSTSTSTGMERFPVITAWASRTMLSRPKSR